MTRSLARIATFATLAFSLAACGNDSTSPTSVTLSGTYNLQSVNGTQMPYSFTDDQGTTYTLQSDVIVFSSNGSFTETAVLRYPDFSGTIQTETLNDNGTYTKNGTAISLRYTDASVVSGTVESSTLVLSGQGYSYVYARQ